MHEFSIASAIVAEVRDAMVANDVEAVSDVTITIGRLSGIVAGALEFGWDIVRQGTVLADTTLTILDDPVVVWCPAGDHALELDDMVFRCVEHDCPTPEVLSGERLEIVRFTIADRAGVATAAPGLEGSGPAIPDPATPHVTPAPEAAA